MRIDLDAFAKWQRTFAKWHVCEVTGIQHSHTFDLLFCRTMVSLGLSARQSDIFKDFTYLCLTWIKPFSVQFAKESTYFERVDKLPMMLFWDFWSARESVQLNEHSEFTLYILLRLFSTLFWLAVTYHHAAQKRGNLSAHVP